MSPLEKALGLLDTLHREVDQRARVISSTLGGCLTCRRGCADCCLDELTVFEIEAEKIRRGCERLLARGSPHPGGRCAFLEPEGACRIYADRPYVCRSQGLPLRWIEETDAGNLVEHRDICRLSLAETSIDYLPGQACFLIGPFEERLVRLQADAFDGQLRRVPLRSLFG